jgi:hypothetical protein
MKIMDASIQFDKAKAKLISAILKSNLTELEKFELLEQKDLYKVWLDIPQIFENTAYYLDFLAELEDDQVEIHSFFECLPFSLNSIITLHEIETYIQENQLKEITLFETDKGETLNLEKSEFDKIMYKWFHDNKVYGFINI